MGIGKERKRHEHMIRELESDFWPVLTGSAEGAFIFLDEEHKVASDRAAELFGYEKTDFEELFPFYRMIIAPESLLEFEAEYYEKIIAERIPTRIEVAALRRDGEKFRARFLMVPISHGEPELVFTLCFVKKIS